MTNLKQEFRVLGFLLKTAEKNDDTEFMRYGVYDRNDDLIGYIIRVRDDFFHIMYWRCETVVGKYSGRSRTRTGIVNVLKIVTGASGDKNASPKPRPLMRLPW